MPISLFSDSMYEAFNHIIKIMWLLYLTQQKPEFLYLSAADITRLYGVNTSGFNG